MNTYVVKNIGDHPIVLEFEDNSSVKLRPNGKYLWQGPEDNLHFLQDYVDSGQLQAWTFEIDFTPQELEPRVMERVAINWLKEGF